MTRVIMAGGGTGGHLFPAIAIAEQLTLLRPDFNILFAGSERGVEARVLPERGLAHRLFPFQPLHRRKWWRNAGWPFLAVRLTREIDAWLDEVTPGLVVGTGGYVSAPVVWRAARRGIPTAILELDVKPGLATRLVASKVDAIWLATEEARAALPGNVVDRIAVTGAPIAPPDRDRKAAAMQRFGLNHDLPVIIVTGGSQGSLALNRVVAEWVGAGGGDGVQLIWVTGRGSHAEFASLHRPPSVQVLDFIDPMADAWAVADIAVARSGMMTLAELAAWGIPALLVPLPSAAADHQLHNARAAEQAGAAVCVEQAQFDRDRLAKSVTGLTGDEPLRAAMSRAALERARPDAAIDLAQRALALASPL